MSNNIIGGRRQVVHAKVTIPISQTTITAENTRIIYLIDEDETSHIPGRDLNGFDSFVAGKGYFFDAILDQDLTDVLAPPFTAGNAILWETGNPITPE